LAFNPNLFVRQNISDIVQVRRDDALA